MHALIPDQLTPEPAAADRPAPFQDPFPAPSDLIRDRHGGVPTPSTNGSTIKKPWPRDFCELSVRPLDGPIRPLFFADTFMT